MRVLAVLTQKQLMAFWFGTTKKDCRNKLKDIYVVIYDKIVNKYYIWFTDLSNLAGKQFIRSLENRLFLP
ncbi:hypothetical protein GCM10028773_46390 [Spirosoma koreense]